MSAAVQYTINNATEIYESSLHGCLSSPKDYIKYNEIRSSHGQDPLPLGLFEVPKNVTILMRGMFGSSSYEVPGSVEIVGVGNRPMINKMLEEQNKNIELFGGLYCYAAGSMCVNICQQGDQASVEKGDHSHVLTKSILRNDIEADSLDKIIESRLEAKGKESPLLQRFNPEVLHTHCADLFNFREGLRSSRRDRTKQDTLKTAADDAKGVYLSQIVECIKNNLSEHGSNIVILISSCQVISPDWFCGVGYIREWDHEGPEPVGDCHPYLGRRPAVIESVSVNIFNTILDSLRNQRHRQKFPFKYLEQFKDIFSVQHDALIKGTTQVKLNAARKIISRVKQTDIVQKGIEIASDNFMRVAAGQAKSPYSKYIRKSAIDLIGSAAENIVWHLTTHDLSGQDVDTLPDVARIPTQNKKVFYAFEDPCEDDFDSVLYSSNGEFGYIPYPPIVYEKHYEELRTYLFSVDEEAMSPTSPRSLRSPKSPKKRKTTRRKYKRKSRTKKRRKSRTKKRRKQKKTKRR